MQDLDPDADLNFLRQDNLEDSRDMSSQYSMQMLDSLDASRASSFSANAYYRMPEQAGLYSQPKDNASASYSPSSIANPSPRFRQGVEYLEPRFVEGRAVDSLAPYHAYRVVDLQGSDIERRQVTSVDATNTSKVVLGFTIALIQAAQGEVRYIGESILRQAESDEWNRSVIERVPVPTSRASYQPVAENRVLTPTRQVVQPTSQPRSNSMSPQMHYHAFSNVGRYVVRRQPSASYMCTFRAEDAGHKSSALTAQYTASHGFEQSRFGGEI